MANTMPWVPRPESVLGALRLCQIQPQTAHSGSIKGTEDVRSVGKSEAMVKQCDRQWSQLMSSFLWCPGERVFYGGMGKEQVAQGCWVIQ